MALTSSNGLDLQQWLKPTAAPAQTKSTAQVIPEGLRLFDANDADFFLDLLPGARNRDGLRPKRR